MTRDVLEKVANLGLLSFRSPKEIDELPSPRVIRPHLSIDLLNPAVLETAKV